MNSQRLNVVLLIIGVTFTLGGLAIGLIGLRGTTPAFANISDAALDRSLVTFFAGAVLFAVGFMTLVTAIFRPMFDRRHVDDLADQHKPR